MNIIVAVNSDWGIGCSGTQQIVIPEDRAYFKEMTTGGIVIAGRKTFEDFGKPLPNRKNIVLTRSPDYTADGAIVVHSVDELRRELRGTANESMMFVIGGESVYRLLLPFCDGAFVTKIEAVPPSDTFFPDLDALPGWSFESRSETFESGGVRYSFNRYINNATEDIYV